VRKRRNLDRRQLALNLEPQNQAPFPALPNPKGLIEALTDLLLEAIGECERRRESAHICRSDTSRCLWGACRRFAPTLCRAHQTERADGSRPQAAKRSRVSASLDAEPFQSIALQGAFFR